MLAAGFIFGVMSFITMMISYRELPVRVQKFFYDRPLATDLAVSGLTLLTITGISSSLVGAVAAMTCGFLVNVVHLVARSNGIKNAFWFLVSTVAGWVGGSESVSEVHALAPIAIQTQDRDSLSTRGGSSIRQRFTWLRRRSVR